MHGKGYPLSWKHRTASTQRLFLGLDSKMVECMANTVRSTSRCKFSRSWFKRDGRRCLRNNSKVRRQSSGKSVADGTGIRNFIVQATVEISSDEGKMRREKGYLNKLNLVLVQVSRHIASASLVAKSPRSSNRHGQKTGHLSFPKSSHHHGQTSHYAKTT